MKGRKTFVNESCRAYDVQGYLNIFKKHKRTVESRDDKL